MNTMNRSYIHYGIILLLLIVPLIAMSADNDVTYRLQHRTGRVIVGQIVERNDEIVIVQDSYGARFQYPMTDIVEISEVVAEEQKQEESVSKGKEKKSRTLTNIKQTSPGIHVAGGLLNLGGVTGGAIAVDFRLGANNLGGKRIFLGGQIGYRGLMAEKKVYSAIPIDVVTEIPLMQGNHVPAISANIGYGIGVGGGIRGGVNAGLAFGYRYHFSRTGALHIGLEAEVQQLASVPHVVEVEPGQTFQSESGKTAVMGMISLGILF